ncbi:MAG: Cys-tRNA(Pro) deacylase [Candidatus Methanogranum gryphiswaldense]|nr:MAG: Cys-tRNA(Pro) deacylase [Candidatus Methanogranum sp. U3.2.1]
MSEQKTNAMRILDQQHVEYSVILYECGEFIDAIHASEISGIPTEVTYKTLVGQGKSEKYCVIVVPANSEVDLKKVAKALDEKFIELIPVKDINKITGYVRGGCSPLGIKKACKIVIDCSVFNHDKVYVSGGRIGCTICLGSKDLVDATGAIVADVVLCEIK